LHCLKSSVPCSGCFLLALGKNAIESQQLTFLGPVHYLQPALFTVPCFCVVAKRCSAGSVYAVSYRTKIIFGNPFNVVTVIKFRCYKGVTANGTALCH
jgi:hypothetical protein